MLNSGGFLSAARNKCSVFTGISIRIKVGGRNVEVGSEGVTRAAGATFRGVQGHAPLGNF